jgi:hypothetical protein
LDGRGASLHDRPTRLALSLGRMHDYWTGTQQAVKLRALFERTSDGLRIPGRYLRLANRPLE